LNEQDLREELEDLRAENERLRQGCIDLTRPFHEIERQVIEIVYRQNNYNKTATARQLRLGARTIQRKFKQWFTT